GWWENIRPELQPEVEEPTYEYRLPEIALIAGCSGDTWTPTSTSNAPSPRIGHSAVWTGSEMIVWGGFDGFNDVNSGGRYNPATDAWAPTNTSNAPSVRETHTAVWTGTEMVVWGGARGDISTNAGGRYNPATDTWRTISTFHAPTARYDHTAVWTS